LAAACVLGLFAAVSCRTTPEPVPQDLLPSEIFQRAQEAVVERSDYDTALAYYQAFLERFPEDFQRIVEAEYEIAFIYYKKRDYQTAERLFRALLERYEAEGGELLPRWPQVLSQKLLEEIDATE
jgi:TolA-binding protein